MKNQPRYALTTIYTTDTELIHRSDMVRSNMNLTHEKIYKRGIESYEQETIKNLGQNNIS